MQAQTTRPSAALVLVEPQVHSQVQALLAVAAARAYLVDDEPTLFQRLWDTPADLIVAEVAEPGPATLALCARIRRYFQLPLLIIADTARDDERAAWLDSGADDVLTLPGSLGELPARCLALMRRVVRQRRRDPDAFYLRTASVRLDILGRRLLLADGAVINLSAVQTRLLALFFVAEGHIITSSSVSLHIFGADGPSERRRLRAVIHDLGRRSAGAELTPRIIAVRGMGYQLTFSEPRR
jgi:DNA-binding response OmpR family regulator